MKTEQKKKRVLLKRWGAKEEQGKRGLAKKWGARERDLNKFFF